MAMIWVGVESDPMDEVGYDAETREMQIKFTAKGRSPSSTYRYPNQSKENAAVMQGDDREARRNLFNSEIKFAPGYERVG